MADGEFSVHVRLDGDVATLDWGGAATQDSLDQAVSLAADDAILGHGARRVEVALPTSDAMARRALHRAGFRLEGVRRQAFTTAAGEHVDVALYSRLADDVVYGPDGFSAVMNSVLPRKRCIAHVLFRDEAGRLLYVAVRYKRDWELPGGIVEPEETPRAGAEREVEEELGLRLSVGGLLCVDWLPPYLGWEDAVELIFDGGVLTPEQIAAATAAENEIAALHWVDADEAARHLIPTAAARLRAILAADSADLPLYLERGERV